MADYIDDDNLWKEDLFATLETSPDATDAELKKSYLKLAKKYHPDKYIDNNNEKLEAQRVFSKITVAYDTLSDPQKKAHYLDLRRLLASHLPENQTGNIATPQTTSVPVQNNESSHTAAPKPEAKPAPKIDDEHSPDRVKELQARSFFDMGVNDFKRKKFDKAIDSLKQAVSIKPDVAEFHSQLGLAYKEKNWISMAQAEFKLALKYDPRDKIAKANISPENAKDKKHEEKKGGLFGGLFNFGKKK